MEFKKFDNLEELEAYLISDESVEEYTDCEEYPVENEDFGEKDFALMFEPVYRVTRGGNTYLAMEGVYMAYDEEAGGPYPEWDISMVYEDVEEDKFDPSKFLYYEQGSAATAVMNYCNILTRINTGG